MIVFVEDMSGSLTINLSSQIKKNISTHLLNLYFIDMLLSHVQPVKIYAVIYESTGFAFRFIT